MPKTKKQDWMNDYLAKNDFIVSSHLSLNKKLNLNDTWDISIRFTGNVNIGYIYLLVIIIEGDTSLALEQIRGNVYILNFIDIINQKFSTNTHLILCGKSNDDFTFYVSRDYVHFEKYDENSLANYFERIDPRFTQNIGADKTINISLNDGFQAWTRARLSRFITINDFDALYIKDNYFYIFELKRINPDINKLEDWRPYCNDYSNYKGCEIIRQSRNLTKDEFRTIAYTLENKSKISIFVFDNITKINSQVSYEGNFAIVAPNQIFQALDEKFQGCMK